MIVIYLLFLILLFVLVQHFRFLGFILFLVLFSIFQFSYEKKCYFYKNNPDIPRYNKEQLYKELQHGDIVNNVDFTNERNHLVYFNFSLIHLMMIIEENGEKYVIDALPYCINDKRILYVQMGYDIFSGGEQKWYVTKTPLMEYLLTSNVQVMRILRSPINQEYIIPKTSFIDLYFKKITYCTLLTGDILVNNNIIKTNKLFRHRPSDVIDQLQENGYESFLLIFSK